MNTKEYQKAKRCCKLANMAAGKNEPWEKFTGAFVGDKLAEGEYLDWKVQVHFTANDKICYIFPMFKINKKVRTRPNIKFVPILDIKNIKILPGRT